MKLMSTLIILAVVLFFISGFFTARAVGAQTPTPTKTVILLHGFNGTPTNWATAKAAYEAAGWQVYAPKLPYAGWSAGDVEKNATWLQQYMTQNGISSAKLDGHSLGGWLVLDMILVQRDPRVTSGVLRDTGTGCYFNIPADQCPGSVLLAQLAAATASPVRVLNLNHLAIIHPGVTETKVYNLPHDAFRTDSRVNADAIGWK